MPEADDFEGEQPESPENENANIRQLREQAKAGREHQAAAEALRREVAFLKAGIDTDSKLGKLLFKSYEGDLSDIEALKTEATEIGALKGTSTPVEGEAGSEEASEPTGTNERRELAANAPADEPSEKHPVQAARDAYDSAMERSSTWEEAAGEFVHSLAEAAMSGDQRAVVVDKR